ncbi:MAG: GspE/PulE family protein [Patescibacteria group bacterium]
MHLAKDDIKKIIIDSGVVAEEELIAAENESLRSNRPITEVLIGRGAISEQNLTDSLADFLEVPSVKLERLNLNSDIIELIPESYAKSRGVILFEFDAEKKIGSLAMADPNDFETINYLRLKLNAWLNVYLATSASLKYALKSYKRKIGEDFNKIIEENIKATVGLKETGNISKIVEAVPIIRILDSVIEHAASLGASDIHFEPFRDKLLVRYRLDGILQEILSLPKEISPILIARIKVVSNLQIDIHNAPQDGRFRFPLEDQFIDIRVSVIPTFHGEKAEMRLLKGSLRPLSLTELGFSRQNLEKLNEAVKKPHGLVLVTGPTGSGKTTTLYAILEILNTPKVNITTIEDPIEYDIPRVNQTQVNVKGGITFATGLRSLMRQNPDIIMIGEIRDEETADIAINAAMTGHLLLSTLHTNDAPTTVPRLIELGIQPFLLASTLNIAIAQRLVRRLCAVCISSKEIDEQNKKLLNKQAKTLNLKIENLPKIIYASKGCSVCGFSGYRGQIGIFEIIFINDAVKDLILKNSPAHVIRKKAREEGMKTLFEDGLEKISAGFTSIEEILRVSSE